MVYQDTFISRIKLDVNKDIVYELHNKNNGLYIFVMEGSIAIGDQTLESRDALGIEEVQSTTINAQNTSEILFLEVPMV